MLTQQRRFPTLMINRTAIRIADAVQDLSQHRVMIYDLCAEGCTYIFESMQTVLTFLG